MNHRSVRKAHALRIARVLRGVRSCLRQTEAIERGTWAAVGRAIDAEEACQALMRQRKRRPGECSGAAENAQQVITVEQFGDDDEVATKKARITIPPR